jgi:rubrerythrin
MSPETARKNTKPGDRVVAAGHHLGERAGVCGYGEASTAELEMPSSMRAGPEMTAQPRGRRDTRDPLERRELICPICGYRIVLDREPDRCPMCGGQQWELAGPRPSGPDEADPPRRSLP